MTNRRYISRICVMITLILMVWAGLGMRLAFLHLGHNEELNEMISKARIKEKRLLGPRGRIFDREGQMLALDLSVNNVCVSPEDIVSNRQVRAVSGLLSSVLGLDPKTVAETASEKGRFYEVVAEHVKSDVGTNLQHQLQRFGFPRKAVWLEDDTARYYPLGEQLCHVLGFSNLEGVGSAGVEQRLDKYLKGREGLKVYEKDGRGREVYARRHLEIKPESGADVYLTIDQKLQHYVEGYIDAAMDEHHAEGAWAIVQDVKTGKILAMSSRPHYDLNDYRNAPEQARLNRAIGYVYEPGSTMKAMIMAGAFNEGVISENELIDCEGGSWSYAGRLLRDYHGYGNLTVADVLKKSSNIGMAKIGLKLGEERVHKYVKDFGLSVRTGINLPGEEAGIFMDVDKWSKMKITRITMGHGIAVTALQVLNAFCCLANDGFLMRPYIVDKVIDNKGYTIFQNEPEVIRRPVSEDVGRRMCRLLGRVTETGGTAKRAQVEGYKVAGKTGTAQKPIPGGYSSTDHIASFVGFLPADNPEIGIIVVVDNPQPKHTGGVVAAPVFRQIAEQAVKYLDIPPHRRTPELMVTRR